MQRLTDGANNMLLDSNADFPAKCRSNPKDVLKLVEKMGNSPRSPNNIKQDKEDYCESDRSKELEYGPGIMHKLRSKYVNHGVVFHDLNMTLKEMIENDLYPYSARRAANHEDLLYCKDETPKNVKRYTHFQMSLLPLPRLEATETPPEVTRVRSV